MFKLMRAVLFVLPFTLFSSFALAQSSSFDNAYAPRGSEARLSFTIPIGEGSKTSKTAPRLDFGLRNYSQRPYAAADWMLESQPNYKEARFGFTLSDKPDFLLNDQVFVLSAQDEQANIGTAGKVGLGVVAVALVTVAVIGIIVIDCFNDSNSNCNGD